MRIVALFWRKDALTDQTCLVLFLIHSIQEGEAYEGKAKGKADVTINTSDDVFMDMADGKLNGQKAFMSGKLKVSGSYVHSPLDLSRPLTQRAPFPCLLCVVPGQGQRHACYQARQRPQGPEGQALKHLARSAGNPVVLA